MRRHRLKLFIAAVVVLATAVTAWAFYSTAGAGDGDVTVGSFDQPSVTVPATSNGSHTVSWTAAELTGNPPEESEIRYTVERRPGTGSFVAAGGSCAGVIATTSCSDSIGTSGDYTYRVTAKFRTWTATSADSSAVAVTVGETFPTVESIVRANASPTKATSVGFTVTFSDSVTGVDANDFDVVMTGVTGASIAWVTGSGDTYTVTVNTGSGSGTLGLDLDDDDSVEDTGGNPLGGNGDDNGNFVGEVYVVDKTAPTVVSIDRVGSTPTNAASVQWTVTFSEAVTGVNTTDFTRTGTQSGASITGVTGSDDTYTVTASTGPGAGTVGINLTDNDSIVDAATNPLGGAGTGNGNFSGPLYTIDKTAPTVQSINRVGSATTNASSVQWTVDFSETVSGVDASDFALAVSGVSGASITGVTGSNDLYTVTASTGSGDGTLGLNLVDDDSINDTAGNALGAGSTGQVFTIDKTAPSLSTLEMIDNDDDGKIDRVVATFSETLANYTAGTAPWTLTDVPSGGSLSTVTVSSTTATLNISEGGGGADTAVGGFKVALAQNAAGIRDAAGNQSFFSATAPVDKAAPARTRTEMFDVNGNGRIDKVEIEFSEQLAPYSAGNTPWGLGSAPSGATLNNVSVGSASATLNLNEGAGAVTTAVGSFNIDLTLNAAGIRDASDNRTSFTNAIPADKAAPVRTLMEAFDATPSATSARDGKIDQLKVTFSENLASSTNTSVWAFSGAVPSSGTLASVSTATSVATLTITPGAGSSPDTAIGTWEVALSPDGSTGIRDSAGNAAQFAAASPNDQASPIPTSFTDANAATDGLFQSGDSAILTFSENVTNTATSTNVLLDGGSGGNNDEWRAQGFLNGTTVTPLGRNDYMSTNNGNANFNSSTIDQPAGNPNQVRLTLAACSSSPATICTSGLGTAAGVGNVDVTPSTTIADASGNTAVRNSASLSFSIKLF